ncbi:hypothetical protein J3A83DRAFT_12962 [Scleroderma citrinum]
MEVTATTSHPDFTRSKLAAQYLLHVSWFILRIDCYYLFYQLYDLLVCICLNFSSCPFVTYGISIQMHWRVKSAFSILSSTTFIWDGSKLLPTPPGGRACESKYWIHLICLGRGKNKAVEHVAPCQDLLVAVPCSRLETSLKGISGVHTPFHRIRACCYLHGCEIPISTFQRISDVWLYMATSLILFESLHIVTSSISMPPFYISLPNSHIILRHSISSPFSHSAIPASSQTCMMCHEILKMAMAQLTLVLRFSPLNWGRDLVKGITVMLFGAALRPTMSFPGFRLIQLILFEAVSSLLQYKPLKHLIFMTSDPVFCLPSMTKRRPTQGIFHCRLVLVASDANTKLIYITVTTEVAWPACGIRHA